MCKWRSVLLAALAAAAAARGEAASAAPFALPDSASGTFVQRKTLADVDVTITSSGTFRFVKGRSFEWKTLNPLPSTFAATPVSYTFTADGKATTRKLSELKMPEGMRALVNGDFSGLADVFDVKREKGGRTAFTPKTRELRDFMKRFTLAGGDFPTRFTLDYANGDRLEIELAKDR